MKFVPADIPGVIIVEPDVHSDVRGFFLETYHAEKYRAGGIADVFVQDNHSRSAHGVLRGLHLQKPPHAQGKLVRVSHGRIFDVAVDIDPTSPTYKRWVGLELDDVEHRQIWIPAGYAHGFVVLSDSADLQYKTTDYYAPGAEVAVRWDDPELAIDWPPLDVPYVLSEKDRAAPTLAEARAARA